MSLSPAAEYLTKQVVVDHNIVTYRSLSRALGIHVNEAKNDLASFYQDHQAKPCPIHATYLVCGYIVAKDQPPVCTDNNGTNVATEMEPLGPECLFKVVLVEANALEVAKRQFQRITSVHIYSVSSSRIFDPDLLTGVSKAIQERDSLQQQKAHSQTFGRIVGASVKASKEALMSKSRKVLDSPSNTSSMSISKGISEFPSLKKSNSLEQSKFADFFGKKSSSSGVRHKTKGASIQDEVPAIQQGPSLTASTQFQADSHAGTTPPQPDPIVQPDADPSSSRVLQATIDPLAMTSATPQTTIRVKNGALLSDDETEQPVRKRILKRTLAVKEEEEEEKDISLRAMMDIDDDQVVNAAHTTVPTLSLSKDIEPGSRQKPGDSSGEEGTQYIDKKKKLPRKKVKGKEVPIGRNGLKKRKVTKSKKEKNEKGYIVSKDYSSWESVSEEESTSQKISPETADGIGSSKSSQTGSKTAVPRVKDKKGIRDFFSKKDS